MMCVFGMPCSSVLMELLSCPFKTHPVDAGRGGMGRYRAGRDAMVVLVALRVEAGKGVEQWEAMCVLVAGSVAEGLGSALGKLP